MDEREHRYRVEIAGLPGAGPILEHDDVRMGVGAVLAMPVRMCVDPYGLAHAGSSLIFLAKLAYDPDLGTQRRARILAPARRAAR